MLATDQSTNNSNQLIYEGVLHRRFHNAPIVISAFDTPQKVAVVLGGTIMPIAGTTSEFYTITNMGDPVAKPDLTIVIHNDFLHMILVGGDGSPMSSFVIPYGGTATFVKTGDSGECIFVNSFAKADAEPPAGNVTVPLAQANPWPLNSAGPGNVDGITGFVNIITGPAEVNLPVSAAGDPAVIVAKAGDLTVSGGGSTTIQGAARLTVRSGDSAYLVYDGISDWVKI